MATLVSDLRAQLRRAVNVPGFAQLPDITNTELDGYIMDGFWEGRLLGLLGGYTQTDGTEFATPPGVVIYKISDDGDLEPAVPADGGADRFVEADPVEDSQPGGQLQGEGRTGRVRTAGVGYHPAGNSGFDGTHRCGS